MASGTNRILTKMLERLFAALVNGPSLNCRPHSSRQRVDWSQLSKFKDLAPEEAFRKLLGPDETAKFTGRLTAPRRAADDDDDDRLDEQVSPEEKAARQSWADQLSLLGKLRGIAEDAKTYEQDTGVHVLNIGFPLLSLPPGAAGGRQRGATRRIIAPIAFIPVSVVIKSGAAPGVVIACKGEGVDRVTPNTALLAWLEQQTGKSLTTDLFADEEGCDPWREISELVRNVCGAMEIAVPDLFVPPPPAPPSPAQDSAANTQNSVPTPIPSFTLSPAPRAEDAEDKPTLLLSAVLGLFPMANQGLLRDMQAMSAGEPLSGPVTSFIQSNVSLDAPREPSTEEPAPAQRVGHTTRTFAEERLIAQADPCQSRAVKLARTARGLVIHGPPGTGKSQTITNIVGDHLSRGERVLLVSDKRTALDVVANRLEHMGLGRLVAIIHDPQRDQRDLYRGIREQLEVLAETITDEKAQKQLAKVDTELQELHGELTDYWDALMKADAADSFHQLVGKWLALPDSSEVARLEGKGDSIALDDLDQHAHLIDETLARAAKVEWCTNPWRDAAGIELAALIAVPMDKWREATRQCVDAASAADATIDPAIPPFAPGLDLKQQADARVNLANRITDALEHVTTEVRTRWADKDEPTQARTRRKLSDVDPQLQALRSAPLDTELAMTARDRLPGMADLAQQLGALEGYLGIASKWYAFLQFKTKTAARAVLAKYGFPLASEAATRLKQFLAGLRSRLALQALHCELYETPAAPGLLSDESLDRTLSEHRELLDLLAHVRASPALMPQLPRVINTLKNPATDLTQGLRASPPRAAAIQSLTDSLTASRLFAKEWLAQFDTILRNGGVAHPTIEPLSNRVADVESILRIRAALAKLPAGVRDALAHLAKEPLDPPAAAGALRKAALAAEITRRLAADPRLQNIDGQRISGAFDRYRKLEDKKRSLVREVILHQWVSRQKERLLAATGSRLGPLGAELKRRLTMRGERAMRLRQVLAAGQKTEGGDPLFDVCPVWMASPETVAQLFARKEVFSVVIFDEASQCRLEETLPVLTRGQRVVIAGDPKQLPPTRFFESAVAQSDDDEIETDQQLFESQQGEIEDLLGAALNIEIEQCYLDVHYRSRSAELIEFSNQHFYGSRLQAIPGHPSNKPPGAPLILHRADGVYDKRENDAEALKVVEIVQDLLKGKETPSIGIACFNLQQRDLIVEKLEALAAEDDRFAKKLAEARTRQGKGSFEGLFVKNLENVQGDERDHMIISTTYGPDKTGRFYRRFGPLGRAGGGRRLNVLVTRAREAVHLVTSIPPDVYRALPPIPGGQAPTGGWLLFAYLKYAEEVQAVYDHPDAASQDKNAPAEPVSTNGQPHVRTLPTKTPSLFAESLAQTLADRHHLSSDVYWGNDGFLVDVALRNPAQTEQVTLGVLCDAARFANAQDPVEWDVFRTGIHEDQGWKLHRLWTPHFFRDPKGVTAALLRDAQP
ncbi:MAG: hypothetical protein JWN40_5419 [Phycisphaerales bacterium]|nr:hypothetical protein [Phycisphaerales bacterium]